MAPVLSFHDTNLPDLQPDTHIIGLCGVNDHYFEDDDEFAPDPARDGWMLSDFYLFKYLCQGLGKSQAWLTSLHPEELVRRYGEFAHGNCYNSRRVVLDKHQMPDPSTLHIESPEGLIPGFLSYLRSQCELAAKVGQPILLCIFCHGDPDTYGLYIGGTEEEGGLLSVQTFSKVISEFTNLDICLLMTSCFSGGWAVVPELRRRDSKSKATVLTAAGPEETSESWSKPDSLGWACGSLYTSAVLNVLEADSASSEEAKVDPQESMNIHQFSEAIASQLLHVIDPRFGSQHDHRFEVQWDQWTQLYRARTGIPLSHYQRRLEDLRVIPARDITDIRKDRSRTNEEVDEWEAKHPMAPAAAIAASNFGGSMRAMKKVLRNAAIKYMKSYPGRSSLAGNIAAHNSVEKAIKTPHLLSNGAWSNLWEILHYRLGSLELAENLAYKLRFKGPRILSWDADQWEISHKGTPVLEQAKRCWRMVLDARIFPRASSAAYAYYKPVRYLAVCCAESRLSEAEIKSRLESATTSKTYSSGICNLHAN
ncbi:hypothetical protein MMC24_007776 [Lignoscripta atroalba]|nr:hypothetical protein [Lignoscripta atroalba]